MMAELPSNESEGQTRTVDIGDVLYYETAGRGEPLI
jgi:hypothetical protein